MVAVDAVTDCCSPDDCECVR